MFLCKKRWQNCNKVSQVNTNLFFFCDKQRFCWKILHWQILRKIIPRTFDIVGLKNNNNKLNLLYLSSDCTDCYQVYGVCVYSWFPDAKNRWSGMLHFILPTGQQVVEVWSSTGLISGRQYSKMPNTCVTNRHPEPIPTPMTIFEERNLTTDHFFSHPASLVSLSSFKFCRENRNSSRFLFVSWQTCFAFLWMKMLFPNFSETLSYWLKPTLAFVTRRR